MQKLGVGHFVDLSSSSKHVTTPDQLVIVFQVQFVEFVLARVLDGEPFPSEVRVVQMVVRYRLRFLQTDSAIFESLEKGGLLNRRD